MKKKKILFIITQGHWGGAQRYVFDLAVNLNKYFDITVAVGEKNGKTDLQKQLATNPSTSSRQGRISLRAGNEQRTINKEQKIKIVQLEYLVRHISPIKDLLAILELQKLYKKTKPDIIHLNSSKAGILGSVAKLFIVHCSLFIVYTAHGWVFNEPIPKLKKCLYKSSEKFTARFKDKIITLSDKDFSDAKNILKIKPEKLDLIKLAIKPPKHKFKKQEARKKLNTFLKNKIESDTFLIGTIANFYPTKGIDILLEAISLKKDRLPKNIKFVIIGNGPEYKNSKIQISNSKIENIVEVPGFIDKAYKLFPAFDLFVLPSRKEGLPYTILEAINYKIPIIATDVGSIGSLIQDKKTGLLCRPNNPEVLNKKIEFALQNKQELQNYAAQAYNNLNSDFDKFIEGTISLYRSLLDQA
ncbi:MAG: glycosyltransferase [Candidatus Magasanikbacteria bacterium]|nr:glycosyltransferase [Candidatus Magasanikbacteria bacterium]